MRLLRKSGVIAAFAVVAALALPVQAPALVDPADTQTQERAAAEVMAQLDATDDQLAMNQIEALGDLGPMPWLSFTPGRSNKAIEAWRAIAAQLPASELESVGASSIGASELTFSESEAPEETGGNDTAETGDPIPGFGTGDGDEQLVTITGALQGGEVRPPIEGDCESTEDDGSITSANETPAAIIEIALCVGEIGDGPFGESSGDLDFYSFGQVEQGTVLILDTAHISGSLDPVNSVIGIYDAEGNLLGSMEDSGNPNEPVFLEVIAPTTGVYYGAIAGCCELSTDPSDSASGPGADETGTYELFVIAFPPPCSSVEDDGSIDLANSTRVEDRAFDFCTGVIGDGPHEAADTDFYSIGVVGSGQLVIADAFSFAEPLRTIVGIYDAEGNLLASGEDSGNPELEEFVAYETTETAELFVAVAGCCELPADPTDPTSGAPSEESGLYELTVGVSDLPCVSTEDDGSLASANATSSQTGEPDLVVTACAGSIGDGPQAEANGDVDFFRTRPLPADRLLIVDFSADTDESADAGDLTIGIYNSGGDLIASGQDDPFQSGPASEFFSVNVPEAGEYYVAIAGGLPTDPSDPTTGTNTDITSGYTTVFIVDTTEEVIGLPGGWASLDTTGASADDESPLAGLMSRMASARSEQSVSSNAEPVVDIDFFLVDLEAGDTISGGFDSSREVGIFDTDGVLRSSSMSNPSFIYPLASPLRHPRRTGFDHVVTKTGTYAVYVAEGVGAYEGELRVIRSGLSSTTGDDQQIIFLDFDGATVPGDVFGTGFDATLSPLSSFLAGWGLAPSDEDAVIDATIDAVVESVDQDLRVRDGRNGDRDASGIAGEFDVEVLNSRDHGDRWGDPNVTRVVIGGTVDELGFETLGIAQSIDPGNAESEETAVVLLDLMSSPAGPDVSINSYGLADGVTKSEFVGFTVGHITAHEIGHVIGNWHQETFNEVEALMDAGGDFPAIAGVGEDGVFGNADDTDPDFVEDIFNLFEGFGGTEDSAGRSAFAFSTGLGIPTGTPITDLTLEIDGAAFPGEPVDIYAEFNGGQAPYSVVVDWGDGASCPGDGTCLVDPMEDAMPGLVDADYTYGAVGVFTITVTVTDVNGASATVSGQTPRCTIVGTSRAETLRGTPGDDVICGLGGNDRIFGEGGNDLLIGGSGRDRMDGGEGDDMLFGGSEPDTMSGGPGSDMMSGGKGNDLMRGGADADVMNGRLGGDRMFGEAGEDIMSGNRGDDRMYGGNDADTMQGRRGSDILHGQNGDDDLRGGQGRDDLNGGRGDDAMDGGTGDDRCLGGVGTNTEVSCER